MVKTTFYVVPRVVVAVHGHRMNGYPLLAFEIHGVYLYPNLFLVTHLLDLVDPSYLFEDLIGEGNIDGVNMDIDSNVAYVCKQNIGIVMLQNYDYGAQ